VDDVREHLDGTRDVTSKPGCDVIATRDDNCSQHGPFIAQQIRLKPSKVPYWLPCPRCKAEWDKANREEQQRFRELESNARMCARTGGLGW